jgi:hypothetical protein
MNLKQCSKCHAVKPETEFKKGICKTCFAAYHAAYRAANRDRIAAYRAANRERIAAVKAAYQAANRERIAAHYAANRAANRERMAAYKAAYRAGKIVTRKSKLFFQTLSFVSKLKQQKQKQKNEAGGVIL